MIKNSLLYLLVTKPNFYLKRIAYRTINVGIFCLALNLVLHYTELDKFEIPDALHSLIGIVIGLLLVFRINTAYERWWEGRKVIGLIESDISIIVSRLDAGGRIYNWSPDTTRGFKAELNRYLTNVESHLSKDSNLITDFSINQKRLIKNAISQLYLIPNYSIMDRNNRNQIEIMLSNLLERSNSLERIKNTPIPLSFVLHMRIAILIYTLTLPFGLFHDMGLWSTLLAMLVYFIIAGVEIISSEIEDPFAGDPNDLPIKDLFKNIRSILND